MRKTTAQPLTGADRFSLYSESAVQPMHILKGLILDPRGGHSPATPEGVRTWLECAVANVLPLRWRLTSAPLGLGAPAWHDAGAVNIDDHLRTATVAAPGGREQLAQLYSELMVEPLDRGRPLWQLWLVDGLSDDRVAHVWKLHHALADGSTSARIFGEIYQHGPDERPTRTDTPSESPSPGGTSQVPIRQALRQHAQLVAELPDLLRRSERALSVTNARRRAGLPAPARMRSGPLTRYNRGLTPHRVCAFVHVRMSDLKIVRETFECTLNDVFLAAAAGALRTHLQCHGELPEAPLTASVPVSTRPAEEAGAYGNRIGMWNLAVPTDIADPVERLRAAHAVARGVRDCAAKTQAPYLLTEWEAHTLMFRPLAAMGDLRRPSARSCPYYNITLSNVPGPRSSYYADGARVTDIQSMSVLSTRQGLNMTGWSYCDGFTVGLVSCPEFEPDLWSLADSIPKAVQELVDAASARRLRSNAVAS